MALTPQHRALRREGYYRPGIRLPRQVGPVPPHHQSVHTQDQGYFPSRVDQLICTRPRGSNDVLVRPGAPTPVLGVTLSTLPLGWAARLFQYPTLVSFGTLPLGFGSASQTLDYSPPHQKILVNAVNPVMAATQSKPNGGTTRWSHPVVGSRVPSKSPYRTFYQGCPAILKSSPLFQSLDTPVAVQRSL